MKYGIQLYSVRDFMARDVYGTLKRLAEMGYEAVEPAGFFDTPAEVFAAWCRELGLEILGSHETAGSLRRPDSLVARAEYLSAVGCSRYVVASAPTADGKKLSETLESFKTAAPLLAERGIELLFHNHHREFLPNEDGKIAHLSMQRETDIKFEIDVYWVYRAGLNPIYILEQMGDRLALIHLKDGTLEEGTPLGQGTAPIAEVVAWAAARDIPMIVENEPPAERQMIEAEQCLAYLRSLEAAKS